MRNLSNLFVIALLPFLSLVPSPALGSDFITELDHQLSAYEAASLAEDDVRQTLALSRVRRQLDQARSIEYVQGLLHIQKTIEKSSHVMNELSPHWALLSQYLQKHWELKYARELEALRRQSETRVRNAKVGALVGAGTWLAIERLSGFLKPVAVAPYFRVFRYLYPLRALLPLAGYTLGSATQSPPPLSSAISSSMKIPPAPAHILLTDSSMDHEVENGYNPEADLKALFQTVSATSAMAWLVLESQVLRPWFLRLAAGANRAITPFKANLLVLAASLVAGIAIEKVGGELYEAHLIHREQKRFEEIRKEYLHLVSSNTTVRLNRIHEAGAELTFQAIRLAALLNLAHPDAPLHPVHEQAIWREELLLRDGRRTHPSLWLEQRRTDRRLARQFAREYESSDLPEIPGINDPQSLLRQVLATLRRTDQSLPPEERGIFDVFQQKIMTHLLAQGAEL